MIDDDNRNFNNNKTNHNNNKYNKNSGIITVINKDQGT